MFETPLLADPGYVPGSRADEHLFSNEPNNGSLVGAYHVHAKGEVMNVYDHCALERFDLLARGVQDLARGILAQEKRIVICRVRPHAQYAGTVNVSNS